MSNPLILRQTYWPDDGSVQRADKVSRLLESIRMPGKALVVEVKHHQKKRSRDAENYLWGVAYVMMSDASGYEKDEIHEAMCAKYFGVKTIRLMGQTMQRPIRTTTINEDGDGDVLSASDYWDFTDFVIREAALWYDVAIPPPDPEKRKR